MSFLPSRCVYDRIAKDVFVKEIKHPNAVLDVGIFDENMCSVEQTNFISGLNKPTVKEIQDFEADQQVIKHVESTNNTYFNDYYMGEAITDEV